MILFKLRHFVEFANYITYALYYFSICSFKVERIQIDPFDEIGCLLRNEYVVVKEEIKRILRGSSKNKLNF